MSSPNSKPPLVSLGIPTYNRSAGLRAALESALAQDYQNLEIIISDNASTDDTPAVAESFCKRDSRVRYIRHPVNLGPIPNFELARQHASGLYFAWLADDDWLGPGVLRRCVEELDANPDYALVSGLVRYYKKGSYAFNGQQMNISADSGFRRVLDFYRQVGDNGIFYGLMRREQIMSVPFLNVMGGDWIFTAAIAFLGKIRTLTTVEICHDYTWDDTSHQRIARTLGLPAYQARHPYLATAIAAYQDIRHTNPIYQQLGDRERWWLACRSWRLLCRRHKLRFPKLFWIYLTERFRRE